MKQTQKAKWERTRAKGMWRFVLLYGAVMAVPMIVATSIFDHFTSPYGLTLRHLQVKVPIFLVSGFITGLVMWFIGEYNYRRSPLSLN